MSESPPSRQEKARACALQLLEYCRSNDWAGYDPYDALNSKVYDAIPLLHFRAMRLALTQLVKRSPINLRPLLLVPQTHNPKGLALFISALVKLSKQSAFPQLSTLNSQLSTLNPQPVVAPHSALRIPHSDGLQPLACASQPLPGSPRPSDGRGIKGEGNGNPQLSTLNSQPLPGSPRPSDGRGIKGEGNGNPQLSTLNPQPVVAPHSALRIPHLDALLHKLAALRSPGAPYWCWGYPFPWQSRAALFPRWLPNVICTSFAGNALLDAFDELGDKQHLAMAASAADFLLETLYYEEGNSVACFSYTPLARSKVHNANLLGAAFLCRVAKLSGKSKYLGPALKAARYSLAHQYPDGSWDYGESDDPPQRWKDNFHTGYNLCALRSIGEHAGTKKFEEPIRRGFGFFREKFILADGTPRYYHDRTYPLDIHSAAQSIITLLCFKDLDPENVVLAQSVCRWAVEHLWRREGYFAFQEHRYYTNRIPYMRWSQAWMLQALSALLEELTPPGGNVGASRGPKGASAAVRGEVAGLPRYVLITPARNEVAFIEETIQSVVAQTVRPVKWVIVSDGSTDGTDEIVKRYAAEHDWIELLRMPERKERHFAGKVLAFNAGYERVRHLPYGFLACMDADISFQPDYFAFLLEKASRDSKLGVVGTAFRDSRVPYDYRFVSTEHVSGPCQVFRRECFEHIGGYLPLRGGGVDHVAVLTARMKGWKTRCFTDKAYHHRDMGSAKHGALGYKFVTGRLDYALGGHPLWELFRVIYQMAKRPWVFGGIMIGAGYTFAALTRSKLSISRELVLFRRREQMVRLKRLILGCPKSGIPLE